MSLAAAPIRPNSPRPPASRTPSPPPARRLVFLAGQTALDGGGRSSATRCPTSSRRR